MNSLRCNILNRPTQNETRTRNAHHAHAVWPFNFLDTDELTKFADTKQLLRSESKSPDNRQRSANVKGIYYPMHINNILNLKFP